MSINMEEFDFEISKEDIRKLKEYSEGIAESSRDIFKHASDIAIDIEAFEPIKGFLEKFDNSMKTITMVSTLVAQFSTQSGLIAGAAGLAFAGIGALVEWHGEREKSLFDGWAGTFALSASQQRLFWTGYTNDLNVILASAKTEFEKILGLKDGANTDEFDVQMEMMRISMKEGVLDPEQMLSMYDSAETQLQLALEGLDMELLRSQALAEMNLTGDEKTNALALLEEERVRKKAELEAQKAELQTLLAENYLEVYAESAWISNSEKLSDKDTFAKLGRFLDEINIKRIANGREELSMDELQTGIALRDVSIWKELLEGIYRTKQPGITDEEIAADVSADYANRSGTGNWAYNELERIIMASSHSNIYPGQLKEIFEAVMEPQLRANRLRIEQDEAAGDVTPEAIFEQTALFEMIERTVKQQPLEISDLIYKALPANYVSNDSWLTYTPTTYAPNQTAKEHLQGGAGAVASTGSDASGGLFGGIQSWVAGLTESIQPVVAEWMEKYGQALIEGGDGLQQTASEVAPVVGESMTTFTQPMLDALGAANEEIAAKLQETRTALTEFAGGLKLAFESGANAESIGLNFSRGIADGIESGTGLGCGRRRGGALW